MDKQRIKNWYKRQESDRLNQGLLILEAINENFPVIQPVSYYKKEVLTYFPIILTQKCDFTNEESILALLLFLVPFTDTIYDYVVLGCSEQEGRLNPTGFLISVQWLRELVSGNNENQCLRFFPHIIDVDFLSSFRENFQVVQADDSFHIDIIDLCQYLWSYSRISQLQDSAETSDYIHGLLIDLTTNINISLENSREFLSDDDFGYLENTVHSTLNGKIFDNKKGNQLVQKFSVFE